MLDHKPKKKMQKKIIVNVPLTKSNLHAHFHYKMSKIKVIGYGHPKPKKLYISHNHKCAVAT